MIPISRSSLLLFSLLLGPLGCSSEDADTVPPTDDAGASSDSEAPTDAATDADATIVSDAEPLPEPLPAATTVLTTEATWAPTHPIEVHTGPNPAFPSALATYVAEGYGERTQAGGEAHVTRAPEGQTPPAPGPGAKRVLRFVHLTDMQVVDDESPARTGLLDSWGSTSAALRPQDPELCRLANAAVRTVNGLHRADPVDFVLLGGDNIDSAQSNELDWFLGIMQGGVPVECDSGDDDNLVAGPGNDGKDAFVSEGLLMPWKWVTGNHDVNVQGNFAASGYEDIAVGDYTGSGTRDYRVGGDVVAGVQIIPDARRALVDRAKLLTRVGSHGDGHGAGSPKVAGKAHYTFDIPGTPIRFVVIDTASELGGAEGVIRKGEMDQVVIPALEEAKSLGKWVFLASHHSQGSLTLNGGTFGSQPPDAMDPEAWADTLGAYPNVLFSFVAHSHEHRVTRIAPKAGGAWWEVMTSAVADFPHEFRVLEVFDQDNGWIMLRATCVDLVTEGDVVTERAVRSGTVDLTTGWNPGDGRGVGPDVRNVEVWAKKPE
ncbi:MAG TPA: metallophosphoesterase [Polyangiaceae bacterium]|nr:metallophosphoesterase [Polyangiaceae bacterium]